MCLTISVELPMMPKGEAELLASRRGPSGGVDLSFEGIATSFGRSNPRLSISESGEGCACSMLTDEADWGAPAWDIRPTLLPHLASTLEFIGGRAPGGFILEALWAGGKPGESLEVSLSELLGIVRENQLGAEVRYIVRAT